MVTIEMNCAKSVKAGRVFLTEIPKPTVFCDQTAELTCNTFLYTLALLC